MLTQGVTQAVYSIARIKKPRLKPTDCRFRDLCIVFLKGWGAEAAWGFFHVLVALYRYGIVADDVAVT